MVAAMPLDPIMQLTADQWRASAARDSLPIYARRMFPGYRSATHIDRLIEALEWAVSTPDARLIVTLPPRHSKSVHVSELLPAWFLGRNPGKRIIAASHSASLAYTFSRRVRNQMLHGAWPFFGVKVADDKGAVQAWDIEGQRGGYVAVGVGGSPTGQGGDGIILDDVLRSAADASSQTVRDSIWEWYQGTIRTRLEPGGFIVLTATRWHEDDLTGRLLGAMSAGGEQWRHVHMPAINDKGEPLWPERWPTEALERIRNAVGSRVFEAQYQGRPAPDAGNVFNRDWWQIYDAPPDRQQFDQIIQSWDMTFRETSSGSYIVGQVWGALDADRYLLDQVRFRGDFPAAVSAVRSLTASWPESHEKIVENKANGPAIVATLRKEIPGLIEVQPEGGKEARANAVAWQVESGNVYLPDPKLKPWAQELIDEAAAFPNGAHDDQVDALSQALLRLQDRGPAFADNIGDFFADLYGAG